MMKKVCVYIDGFNVFHAIKKAFGKKYYWINYKQLARQYIDIKNEKLVDVYYFSAYFYVDKEGVENHKEYVRALQRKGVKIILGKYLEKDATFVKKRHPIVSVKYGDRIDTQKEVIKNLPVPDLLTYNKYEEKRTDVNMAVQIVIDGLQDKYDKAIIITGDSDIAPAIEAIKRIKQKEFLAVIPIGRK
ncbi:MAG: NYN domain-containing protein [bacterium]|nr:NYN domain-containing protein [bacterium]